MIDRPENPPDYVQLYRVDLYHPHDAPPKAITVRPGLKERFCAFMAQRTALTNLLAFLISALAFTTIILVAYVIRDLPDTSRPCNDADYLDKAHALTEQFWHDYHWELKVWMGKGEKKETTRQDHPQISQTLKSAIADYERKQAKMAQSDEKDYRLHLAAKQVTAAIFSDIPSESMWTRFVIALGDERSLEIYRFLADYVDYPSKDALERFSAILSKYDRKFSEFRVKLSGAAPNATLEKFWNDLKAKNTPGLRERCMEELSGAQEMIDEYNRSFYQKLDRCAPGDPRYKLANSDFYTFVVFFALIPCGLIFCSCALLLKCCFKRRI